MEWLVPKLMSVFVLQEPTPEPPAEQTASIFSMAIYSFLDPTVFLAYRIPHLSFDQLPPLADYDHAKNLVNMSFPVSIICRCVP